MQARWYHPEVGRFMALDPVDTIGHINRGNKVQGFNRYGYANNNPYRYVDPDGEFIFAAITVALVAYSAYEGYQAGGTEGAIREASGYNDAMASLEAYERGDYSEAAVSAFGIVCKVCKGGKKAGEILDTVAKKVDLNETGSYTNLHKSGMKYHGKGSRKRSQISGRREAGRNDDPHVATDWTPAANSREAFKQESRRLDADGGAGSSTNYNRIEQPGKKYRKEDGEL